MKPRLRSADLTQEDWIAWLHARHGFLEIRWLDLIDAYETADRRDADLMLQLTDLRAIGAYANVRIRQTWWGQDGFGFTGGLIEWRGKPVQV